MASLVKIIGLVVQIVFESCSNMQILNTFNLEAEHFIIHIEAYNYTC